MIPTFRNGRGLSLIELMIAGALFGMLMTMVARAVVMGQFAQRTVSEKVDVTRHASLALDLLARDLRSAPNSNFVQLGTGNLAAPPGSRPIYGTELRITRYRSAGGPTTAPSTVVAAYWLETSGLVAGEYTVRRILRDGAGVPLPGEDPNGKVMVRKVREFLVSSAGGPGSQVIAADISVLQIGSPISASVSIPIPTPP